MNNKKLLLIVGVVSILVVLLCGVLFITLKLVDKSDTKEPDKIVEIEKSEYKFSLNFGGVLYDLYLINKEKVKVVTTSEIYEVCSGTNCLVPSGKMDIKENILKLEKDELDIVIDVYEDLFKDGKTELNITEVELDDKQELVIYSLVLDSGDSITIDKDLKFNTTTKELKYDGKTFLSNKVMYIEKSDNEVVNNIRDYINRIVDDNYNQIEKEFNLLKDDFKLMSNADKQDFDLKLNVEYIGHSNISISFALEGSYYGYNYYLVNGYTFNIFNGNVIKEIPRGFNSKLYDAAIKEIESNNEYKEMINDFTKDWKDILKVEMFKEGNWYLDKDKICFLINPNYLGVNYLKIMYIDVPFTEGGL